MCQIFPPEGKIQCKNVQAFSQVAHKIITCSESTIEIIEKLVKYLKS